jgi:hypothetical protein
MYLSCRLSPALIVRSPIRQCVVVSARWVSEMVLATAWVWETIAVLSTLGALSCLPYVEVGVVMEEWEVEKGGRGKRYSEVQQAELGRREKGRRLSAGEGGRRKLKSGQR